MSWLFGRREAGPPAAPGAVAVVLQATGSHAWAVSGGWGRAAAALGILDRVIAPRARWGAPSPDDDGGLAAWLRRARAGDLVLLPGFDWHSQALHRSRRWRRRLSDTRARKVLLVQESLGAARRLTGSDDMERAFRSAAELCDLVAYADPSDGPVVAAAGRPARWQPFGVDPALFRPLSPFLAREPRAFFRGKVDAFGDEREYAERRRLLGELRATGLLEVIPYTPGPVEVEGLVADFNRFQLALNLPSVFAGHPTRVLEGMACGCCVLTNRTGLPEVDGLFQDGAELFYYSGPAELAEAVRRCRADPAAASSVAERGRRKAVERFALTRLLQDLLTWAGSLAPGLAPR